MSRVYTPRWAISVRQPWAWAIIYAGKDIENRAWRPANPAMRFRGPVCIHAAKGMTRDEYETARDFMSSIGVTCPPPAALPRSGIIGAACVDDIVTESDSPWFFGPKGLRLTGAVPLDFTPAIGALGFFEWQGRPLPEIPEPAKWMLLGESKPLPVQAEFNIEGQSK